MKKVRETKTPYRTARAEIPLGDEPQREIRTHGLRLERDSQLSPSEGNKPITVPPNVVEELNEIAKWEGLSVEQVVGEAVFHYASQVRRRKIDAEAEAYKRKHPRLRAKYLGQYIAMHNGRVVDCDRDLSLLYNRVRKRFGRIPVLMRLVEEVAERVLVFRSPRLEPME